MGLAKICLPNISQRLFETTVGGSPGHGCGVLSKKLTALWGLICHTQVRDKYGHVLDLVSVLSLSEGEISQVQQISTTAPRHRCVFTAVGCVTVTSSRKRDFQHRQDSWLSWEQAESWMRFYRQKQTTQVGKQDHLQPRLTPKRISFQNPWVQTSGAHGLESGSTCDQGYEKGDHLCLPVFTKLWGKWWLTRARDRQFLKIPRRAAIYHLEVHCYSGHRSNKGISHVAPIYRSKVSSRQLGCSVQERIERHWDSSSGLSLQVLPLQIHLIQLQSRVLGKQTVL